MELSEQLKKYRKQENLTQKELAQKLNVSDKTVSSWETGRTYPDISLLINLSSILKVSLDEILKGDIGTVEKIDKDLKKKKVYKIWLVGILVALIVFIGGFGFLANYQYKNALVDRFNPLLSTEVGFTTLPDNSTLKIGKDSKKRDINSGKYRDMIVTDDAWGNASLLDFYGGYHPKSRSYAMVSHKGIYVSKISFVDWNSIPRLYRNNMFKHYSQMHDMAEGIYEAKSQNEKHFKMQTVVE